MATVPPVIGAELVQIRPRKNAAIGANNGALRPAHGFRRSTAAYRGLRDIDRSIDLRRPDDFQRPGETCDPGFYVGFVTRPTEFALPQLPENMGQCDPGVTQRFDRMAKSRID